VKPMNLRVGTSQETSIEIDVLPSYRPPGSLSQFVAKFGRSNFCAVQGEKYLMRSNIRCPHGYM
jgi:hypothetical protein